MISLQKKKEVIHGDIKIDTVEPIWRGQECLT